MNTNEHCCEGIKRLVDDSQSPLIYEPVHRLYSLVSIPRAFRKKNEVSIGFDIAYCPRCSAKLPKSLLSQWLKIVKKEFKIQDILDERIKDLPQEFKTDEWWKKRNL